MDFTLFEIFLGLGALTVICVFLMSRPKPVSLDRQVRRAQGLAPISKDAMRMVEREAHLAAIDFRDSGYPTSNPYPVGTRQRIIWETTFHSVAMD